MQIFCCAEFNLFFGRTVTLYSYTQLASSRESAWILFGLMPYFRQAISHIYVAVLRQKIRVLCAMTPVDLWLLTFQRILLLTSSDSEQCKNIIFLNYSKTCLKRNAIVPVFFFRFHRFPFYKGLCFNKTKYKKYDRLGLQ